MISEDASVATVLCSGRGSLGLQANLRYKHLYVDIECLMLKRHRPRSVFKSIESSISLALDV